MSRPISAIRIAAAVDSDPGDLLEPGDTHQRKGPDGLRSGRRPLQGQRWSRRPGPASVPAGTDDGRRRSPTEARRTPPPDGRILRRMLDRASSASTLGSRSAPINAVIIARPETPKMSEATTDSLRQASSSSFSTRFFSAVRTPTRSARYQVRYRSWRMSAGGTKLGPQHLALGDLAQPDRVQPVGLGPSGQMLHILRVHQPRIQTVGLKQVERRPPIVAGRLHHHPLHTKFDQPVRQLAQRRNHRRMRGHLLHPSLAAPRSRHPDAAAPISALPMSNAATRSMICSSSLDSTNTHLTPS